MAKKSQSAFFGGKIRNWKVFFFLLNKKMESSFSRFKQKEKVCLVENLYLIDFDPQIYRFFGCFLP